MSRQRLLIIFWIQLIVLATLTGCGNTSRNMRPVASPQPLVAPPDAAVVVFMRPSGVGKAVLFTVVDENGRFVGDAQADARFAVTVPPGEHLFFTWSENTAPLRANLAPGRVYFVEVVPRMGVFRARVHLLAIAPRTDRWRKLQDWTNDTELLEPDIAKGEAYLATKKDKVQERLKSAREVLTDLDQKELMERTLMPDDGIQTAFAVPAGAVPVAPPQPTPVASQ